MAQAAPLQKKRMVKADFWWIVGTGLILAAPNAWVVFQAANTVQPYANYLDLSLNKGTENLETIYLLYFLLFGLIMFLAGLLRGWVTGKADSSLLTSLEASLFGARWLLLS
jgi:hypothetical protein